MMDITRTAEPKSDQQNFDDYAAGPRVVTISEVRKGSAEQPVEIHLVEFPDRPYKPSKSMRRVLIAAWGPEASAYAGRRLKLYGDPSVKFAGAQVGGIKIAALSNIDKKLTLQLTATKGKRAPHTVEPLAATEQTAATASADTLAELAQLFEQAGIPTEQQLPGTNHIIGATVTSLDALTEPQARQVIAALKQRIGQ